MNQLEEGQRYINLLKQMDQSFIDSLNDISDKNNLNGKEVNIFLIISIIFVVGLLIGKFI